MKRVATWILAAALGATVPLMLAAQSLALHAVALQRRGSAAVVNTSPSDTVTVHRQPKGNRPPDPEIAGDHWFGRDKAYHFTVSAALQFVGYRVLRSTGVSRSRALFDASVITAVAGIGKEGWDRMGHGDASVRDLVWDGAGLVTGSGLVRIIDPP